MLEQNQSLIVWMYENVALKPTALCASLTQAASLHLKEKKMKRIKLLRIL